jgi:hypothetical protein
MGYRNKATICEAVSSALDQDCDEAIEVVVVTSGGDPLGSLVREQS